MKLHFLQFTFFRQPESVILMSIFKTKRKKNGLSVFQNYNKSSICSTFFEYSAISSYPCSMQTHMQTVCNPQINRNILAKLSPNNWKLKLSF